MAPAGSAVLALVPSTLPSAKPGAPSMDVFPTTCAICLDAIQGPMLRKLCSETCPGMLCAACFQRYTEVHIASILHGVVSTLKCPICVVPMNLLRVLDSVGPDAVASIRDAVEASCEIRCPICDDTYVLLPDVHDETIEHLATVASEQQLVALFPSTLQPFVLPLLAYCSYRLSAPAFFALVQAQDALSLDVLLPALLARIFDPQRRACLFLAWRQKDPFSVTSCCHHPVCFLCKTAGHHKGVSCRENAATIVDMAQCPHCFLYLVKGDGCDSILCFCGTSSNWLDEVDALRRRMLLTPSTIASFSRVLAFLRRCVHRRRMVDVVLPQMTARVLAAKVARIQLRLAQPATWPARQTLLQYVYRRRYSRSVLGRLPALVHGWRQEHLRRVFSTTVVPSILSAVAHARHARIREVLRTSRPRRRALEQLVVAFRRVCFGRALQPVLDQVPAAVAAKRRVQLNAALPRWGLFKALVLRWVYRSRYRSIVAAMPVMCCSGA
ncbi:hypothetical protein SPRG_11961 [Saprolegnia parasitica CBS 223.65]|uniref:RING-type domain-containing protein n=1 Tax=Saprolegnia parasitica (strain CBS 223.65) TaxID=695850 RepID=A0A067C8J2_SAPPC|nr:hypothetical protein SPRG_11961 [Saprolegnia parasitica CBS 223.65]KDO23117.1 hypothetical protein SPRG_11961 [Saprolegnia parasitica CBS 223.65]|eukprot:XP_012206228.1 hypothetical protein SPRG_11961 [Saprolegnia parasitica CBS 223.65]